MAGLVPAIHAVQWQPVFRCGSNGLAWMPVASAGMTRCSNYGAMRRAARCQMTVADLSIPPLVR